MSTRWKRSDEPHAERQANQPGRSQNPGGPGRRRDPALGAIKAGDLVFFDTDGPGASHVGIALGLETAISATTHGVMEHPLTTGYWGERLIGARRVGS
jgi:cell wall-associated NlpC family hydrolase